MLYCLITNRKANSILKSIIIFLVFILFYPSYLVSESAEKSIWDILIGDFNSAFDDLGFIVNDIGNSDEYTAMKYGGILIGTAALVPADMPLYNYINDNQVEGSFEESLLKVTDHFGTIPVADGLAIGTYLTGLAIGDEYVRTTGRLMVETLVLSGFITITSRVIIGRSRPYNLKGNGTFNPFTFDYFYHSFPSGHITISFALATLLSQRIDTWWAYTGFYTLALLNTASRLYFSGHWASDTFISASIGTLSALTVLKAFEINNSIGGKETNLDLGITPFGIAVQYKF